MTVITLVAYDSLDTTNDEAKQRLKLVARRLA